MSKSTVKPKFNIKFHNPNSNDEIANFFVKFIAGQKVNELLDIKIHISEPQM